MIQKLSYGSKNVLYLLKFFLMQLMFKITIKILRDSGFKKMFKLIKCSICPFHLLHSQLKIRARKKYLNTQVVIVKILKALSNNFLKWKVLFDSTYKML